MQDIPGTTTRNLRRQRWEIGVQVARWLDKPMTALAFVWLALLILEFTSGLSPFLESLTVVIWIAFAVQFLVEFAIAPRKWTYLRHNWITALALGLPAIRTLRLLRAFRALRGLRAARGLRLIRLVTSANRGMRATGRYLAQRGFGYVVTITLLILFAGAAGVRFFESPRSLAEAGLSGPGISSYAEAVWWTAMLLTTMGSQYWPQTPEGRVLCLLLSLYAFAVFGYITATIASYFVGKDRNEVAKSVAAATETEQLRSSLAALENQVSDLLLLMRKMEGEAGSR